MSSPTTLSDADVEEYIEAVRRALADLPAAVRDDLLEDLPDHLAEIAAEADGSLRDQLGTPSDYAAELRAAAGLGIAPSRGKLLRTERILRCVARGTEQARRLDARVGTTLGFESLRDLARALAPGWWVLRGWLVAQLVCRASDGYQWRGVLPRAGSSLGFGILVTALAVIGSVWAGRKAQRASIWPKRLMVGVSLVVCVWTVTAVSSWINGTDAAWYPEVPGVEATSAAPTDSVSDVYVYDADGNPVPNARLYDQNGRPINIGMPTCLDASNASSAPTEGASASAYAYASDGQVVEEGASGNQPWTYPLCPGNPGPFRAGPGAVSPNASGTAIAPTPSAPAPSAPSPTPGPSQPPK